MLININPMTGDVSKVEAKSQDKVLDICDRLKEELEGWVDYHNMAKAGDTRYSIVASQEFQHALVAMSDLLDNLKGRLTSEEMEQFQKFRTECLAK